MSVEGGERAELYIGKRSFEKSLSKKKAGLCDPKERREQILLFF